MKDTSDSNNSGSTARWPIPVIPCKGCTHKLAFSHASEETQAKFRELYPVTVNKEMATWFGISYATVVRLARRLNLKKDMTAINRHLGSSSSSPIGWRGIGKVQRYIRKTDPERFADIQRRKSQAMRKQWRRARIQAEYGLSRTVRLHVSPLNERQKCYKKQMNVNHYFRDPTHPYWVCYDSQTTRSPRMEAHAESLGLTIVEGEG